MIKKMKRFKCEACDPKYPCFFEFELDNVSKPYMCPVYMMKSNWKLIKRR